MKISESTKLVLKNFNTINGNLMLKEGQQIATKNVMGTFFAYATVEDSFPADFGIYDLGTFLASMGLFESPELTFQNEQCMMSENGSKLIYVAAQPSILSFPSGSIKLPSSEVKFLLQAQKLAKLLSASRTLSLPDFRIRSDGHSIFGAVVNKKNPSANSFELELDNTGNGTEFSVYLLTENMKMIPGNYTVDISDKLVTRFEFDKQSREDVKIDSLVYYLACEKDSKFQ